MSGTGSAFVKGGFGCLLAFLAIGLIFVMIGGSMHIDLGGAIMLFVVGGVIGLIFFAVYKKGYAEGKGPEEGRSDSHQSEEG